jgi:hypothetical protein
MFPCFVTWNSLLTKHTCSKEVGFDPSRITYFTFGIMYSIIMMISVFIWVSQDNFQLDMFIVGFVGSFINIIGLNCITIALSNGPLGPALAIVALSSMTFII